MHVYVNEALRCSYVHVACPGCPHWQTWELWVACRWLCGCENQETMFFERLFGSLRNLYDSTTDENNIRVLQNVLLYIHSDKQESWALHVCDFVVARIEGSMFFERLFGNFRNLYNSTTDNNNVRELQMYYCKLLSNSQKHSLYIKRVGVGITRQCRAWKMAKRNWFHLYTLYM